MPTKRKEKKKNTLTQFHCLLTTEKKENLATITTIYRSVSFLKKLISSSNI
jgi:hypothetical protein